MVASTQAVLDTARKDKAAHEYDEELLGIPGGTASCESAMYSILRYAIALSQIIMQDTNHPLGVYLTDLTFIEDGIPATIKKSDLINFAKRAKTAEVIREIQTYQNVAYPFRTVPELLEMMIPVINESPDVSDQDTYDLSLKLEPREREDEKIAR